VPEDFFDDLDDLTHGTEPEPGFSGAAERSGLQKLASLVEDLNRDLSTVTILDRVMSAAIELTGAERGFLVLVNEDGEWSFRVARHMDHAAIEHAERVASHTIIRKVLDGRRPILINDVVGASDLTKQQSIAKMQVRSIMGAPLISKGKLLGAAYVDTSRLAGVFDQTSLVLFETFAQLAAVALENARLIEAERQASERSRSLQEYLDSVLRSQPHGIIILDQSLRLEYANPQASRFLDNSEFEPGTAFVDARCCSNGTMLKLLSDLHDFLQTGYPHRFTFEIGPRTLAYSFFRVDAPGDGHERVGLILEDITVQKQLETKLLESERQSTVSQLAGGIAHEINNSLQPVKGRVELLALRLKEAGVPLENGVDKDLETINALSERIEKIARNLRHLTRPTSINFEPLNLTALVDSTVDLMETTTGTLKGFSSDPGSAYQLVVDLEDDPPPILGDAHGIESAIINMILNSCYAIRERGKGLLRLSVKSTPEGVELVVKDTGGGIAPEILPHVFEPYFTTRGESGGTGLGMCIIQNVVDIHNARIELRSEWGEGTKIAVTFPAAPVPVPE
jgi:two-component system NtrC family sensor kinase